MHLFFGFFFFLFQQWWNFSAGLLDSHEGTVIHQWLSELMFCGGMVIENSYSAVLLMSVLQYQFFFKRLAKFTSKAIWSWAFLCEKLMMMMMMNSN